MADEFGWLIEFLETPPSYWDGWGCWGSTWDSLEAVRFARKVDAERVAERVVTRPAIVIEHAWSDIRG